MTTFEIVDAPPARLSKSRYNAIHLELMQVMLKVPPGKSVRRAHNTPSEAKSYMNSLHGFIKRQKLGESYFVKAPKQAEEGKFYVYIGRREGE